LGAVSAIEAAHVIGHQVGIEWENSPYLEDMAAQPERRKQRAFELTRELFSRLAETGSVVLLIDDLQWVDRGSLDLLAHLAHPSGGPLPLFLLAGARSEFPKSNIQWLNIANLMPLRPISFNASLVKAAYPALDAYPEEILTSLSTRCEGNPYFLEEIVKSIVQSEGEFSTAPTVPPEAVTTNLPQSLRELLQARLDTLPGDAREVLLLASVVGRMFWVGAIKAAAKQPVGTGLLNLPDEVLDRVVQNALRHLVRAEMAFPRSDSIFADQQEFIFKHAMLREVAYDLLPLKYRRFYHFAIARWLSKRAGPDFHVMIAGHYEHAGGISAALQHYNRAVKYAEASGAVVDVEWLTNRIQAIQSGEADESGVQRPNPA
jgi:predicted ATPase